MPQNQNVLLLYMSLYKLKFEPEKKPRPQTNETAVTALYKDKHSRPGLILALCSEDVCSKPTVSLPDEGGQTRTTLDYFQNVFLPKVGLPPEILTVIPVKNSPDDADQAAAIQALIDNIHVGDDLYIDLSGGLRDAAMLMVTAARILRELRDVQTCRVLYSELINGQSVPHDVTALYDLYDLISAIDQFFATGSAHRLKSYWDAARLLRQKANGVEITQLLDSINRFSDHLALCQVDCLQQDLKNIAKCIKQAPVSEPDLNSLFFSLLRERFQETFASLLDGRNDSLPGLVKWCAEHSLYQQALTLLCEKMPDYVCRHIFFQPTQKGLDYMKAQQKNKGQKWPYPLFHLHLCHLAMFHIYPYSAPSKPRPEYTANLIVSISDSDNTLYRVANESELQSYFDKTRSKGELEFDSAQRNNILEAARLYQSAMQYRNQINHASGPVQGLSQEDVLPLTSKAINSTLTTTADFLESIRPYTPAIPDSVTPLPVDMRL